MSEEELACWKEDVPQFDPNSETVHCRAAQGPKAEANHCPTCVVRVSALGEGFGSKSAALCMICGMASSLDLPPVLLWSVVGYVWCVAR
jgi:hypothetical protein